MFNYNASPALTAPTPYRSACLCGALVCDCASARVVEAAWAARGGRRLLGCFTGVEGHGCPLSPSERALARRIGHEPASWEADR